MMGWLKKLISSSSITSSASVETAATSRALDPAQSRTSIECKSKGDKCLELAKFADAAEFYCQALAINPDYPEALDNLGIAYWQLNKYQEAENCLKRAILINPDMANTHYNLGSLLHEQGKRNEALLCLDRSLELKPYFGEAHLLKGLVLNELGRIKEAEASFRLARIQTLRQSQQLCDWRDLDERIQFVRHNVLELPPDEANLLPPLAFLSLPGVSAMEQKQYAEIYAQIRFQESATLRSRLSFNLERPRHDKIRIGYLSADFRQHPVSLLMVEVFERHDRNRFHITAYSYGHNDGSEIRKRLERAFDKFTDIRNLSIEAAAHKIYDDEIDILIDLSGYTQDARTGIMALRPAPIQVNYLGYPGTMGADFVDYLIADRFVIPSEHLKYYTETVAWLPDCFIPNDSTRPRPSAPSRKECGLPNHGFVFCCFNQTFKITPAIYDVWCRLLRAVPASILWLSASDPHSEGNLLREAELRGVEPGRIITAKRLENLELHLGRLQCADLFLDTIPYNAHATCADALWVGLPIVTCAGETFSSRVAGSLLETLGMSDLITYNLDDYYAVALELANDRSKLDAVRKKIIARRDLSPLFDSGKFTHNLEAVYVQMAK